MPNTREKLIELSDIEVLQREKECVKRKSATNCTDCLTCDLLMTDERIISAYDNAIMALRIANGVTVQQWIPVTERLPEFGKRVLILGNRKDGQFIYIDQICADGNWLLVNWEVTHWMPLPEPSKGMQTRSIPAEMRVEE